MQEAFNISKFKKIHFIGIGGVSMSGLAKYCLVSGLSVSGSDRTWSESLTKLKNLGARVYQGHSAINVENVDAVVYSSAIGTNNEELKYAIEHTIPVFKRSEFLAMIANLHKTQIAISGSHGKTTTTAMISECLMENGNKPTCFIGGESIHNGNFVSGEKNFCVYEACEYQKNFLDFSPNYSVILNIDNDHLDSFKSMGKMINCFYSFCKNSICIYNADDKNACKIYNPCSVSFGIDANATYMAKHIKRTGRAYSFNLYVCERKLGRIKLKINGKHNIYNALACIALCFELGVSFSCIKRTLENFSGVKRRDEDIGKIGNLNAFCDYAHHPKEIEAYINSVENCNGKNIYVFQPHTYSRTELLMNDFIKVLKNVDSLIIYKTYPARESFNVKGDGKTLYKELLGAKSVEKSRIEYCQSEQELICAIEQMSNQKTNVFFLGAGDIYDLAIKLCKNNKK